MHMIHVIQINRTNNKGNKRKKGVGGEKRRRRNGTVFIYPWYHTYIISFKIIIVVFTVILVNQSKLVKKTLSSFFEIVSS